MRGITLLLPVVLSNAVTIVLIATGRMSPIELLLLISLEIIALTLINIGRQAWQVGGHRLGKQTLLHFAALSVVQALLVLVICALLAMQVFMILVFGVQDAGWEQLLDPVGMLVGSLVGLPLALTLAGALWDLAVGEYDAIERQIAARYFALAIGVVPFIAPVLLLGGALMKELRSGNPETWTVKSQLSDPPAHKADSAGGIHWSRRGVVLLVVTGLVVLAGFELAPTLFGLGVIGWLWSFLSIKILLEVWLALALAKPNCNASEADAATG